MSGRDAYLDGLLEKVYLGLERGRWLENVLKSIKFHNKDFRIPKELQQRVAKLLKRKPTLRWDEALAEIVNASSVRSGSPDNKGTALPKDLQRRIAAVLKGRS